MLEWHLPWVGSALGPGEIGVECLHRFRELPRESVPPSDTTRDLRFRDVVCASQAFGRPRCLTRRAAVAMGDPRPRQTRERSGSGARGAPSRFWDGTSSLTGCLEPGLGG